MNILYFFVHPKDEWFWVVMGCQKYYVEYYVYFVVLRGGRNIFDVSSKCTSAYNYPILIYFHVGVIRLTP